MLRLAHWKCPVVEGEMKKAHLAVTLPRPLGVQMCAPASLSHQGTESSLTKILTYFN